MATYTDYLALIKSGRYKIVWRLEFLQPDGSVAFSLGNRIKRGYQKQFDTRAFLQDGTLNISLQNGIRRKATVKLSNVDNAFTYAFSHVWFGKQVRLLGGVELENNDEFLLPQGVFEIENPQATVNPNERTVTYSLVDKWANLNGELGGTFDTTMRIERETNGVNTNIFDAMQSVLHFSKYDYQFTPDKLAQLDSTPPVFTTYYNGKQYLDVENNVLVNYTDLPYEIVIDGLNGTAADILTELNAVLAGWIGYDATGALRVEPSQDDISDDNKPLLWSFSTENSLLCGISETAKNTEVKNDIIIVGETLEEREIWGRASNYDPASDTNINLIGRKTYKEAKSNYWTVEQCKALAEWTLKRKTILQKSVTLTCAPMFHLFENGMVSVKRTDKEGSPVERHLIQSFSIPIAESGTMSINCTSVNDIPTFDVSSAADNAVPGATTTLFSGNIVIQSSTIAFLNFPAGTDTSAPATWTVRVIPPEEYAYDPNEWVSLSYSGGSFAAQLDHADVSVSKVGGSWYFTAHTTNQSTPASGTYYLQIYIQS